MADSVRAWGYACPGCRIAWKGSLSDPCPECKRLGKRVVFEDEELDECETCGVACLKGTEKCPRCVRLHNGLVAARFTADCDREWIELFDSLPGFLGWSAARERAMVLATRQRIRLLELSGIDAEVV